jgi:hypothetical protein
MVRRLEEHVAGKYSIIIVVIVGKDVKWVVIACMALMDQWHLSDGIGYHNVVGFGS